MQVAELEPQSQNIETTEPETLDIDAMLAEVEQAEQQRQDDERRQDWQLYVSALRSQRTGDYLNGQQIDSLYSAMQRIGRNRNTFRADLTALAQRDEFQRQLTEAESKAPSVDTLIRLQTESIAAQANRGLDRTAASAAADAYNKADELVSAVQGQRSLLNQLEREFAELFERYDSLENAVVG